LYDEVQKIIENELLGSTNPLMLEKAQALAELSPLPTLE
jgi:hypothetical protein